MGEHRRTCPQVPRGRTHRTRRSGSDWSCRLSLAGRFTGTPPEPIPPKPRRRRPGRVPSHHPMARSDTQRPAASGPGRQHHRDSRRPARNGPSINDGGIGAAIHLRRDPNTPGRRCFWGQKRKPRVHVRTADSGTARMTPTCAMGQPHSPARPLACAKKRRRRRPSTTSLLLARTENLGSTAAPGPCDVDAVRHLRRRRIRARGRRNCHSACSELGKRCRSQQSRSAS